MSGVGDALIFASFRVNHSALLCHLCSEPLTKLNYNTAVLFVMLCTAALLLQAVCFEAEGNKMIATSKATIKVRAPMMGVLDNIGCNVVKKESICSAAVKDWKCRLCGANLKMKGSLNFKQLWCQLQMRLIRERCTFKHSLQYVQLRIPATVHTPRIDARKY